MRTSETQGELVKALIAAQNEFQPISKSKQGQSGHRTFNYAPLDKILDAIGPMLRKHGLLLTQGTIGHELVTRLDHTSGEWREIVMPVNAEHANMQSYGIEITYRRRYSTQLIVGIVTEEDQDIKLKERRKGVDHTEQRNDNGTLRGPGSIKATDGAENNVSAERRAELDEMAAYMVECHENGNDMKVIKMWSDLLENDDKVYLWQQLGPYSKLRATIKANKQAA